MQQKTELFKNYPDVIKIDDLCKMLRIGKNLAYRIVLDGTIPAKKLGREYIIPKSCVINYLEANA